MNRPSFDHDYWNALWSRTLSTHADGLAARPPNAHLLAEAAALTPAHALDAGCGHGAESLWLAAHGWQVTAVDFAPAALAHARSLAAAAGAELAARIEWIQADLGHWTPEPQRFDLVLCLYVHIAGRVDAMVRRMAAGVAPGGILLMVGHRPVDPLTGAATRAADQVQVSVPEALAELDPAGWDILIAEDRPRTQAGTGVDAVIKARRRQA